MSKAVVYRGGASEFRGDREVAQVTVADGGVTEIKEGAFEGCEGLKNLSFLKDSAITTVGEVAFRRSGIVTLQGMERVRKIGNVAFGECDDLRTIEGLGCEEMGDWCFADCTLLQSMKGWPASMTVIPGGCFSHCNGMTTVDCDLSRVTSIGASAFWGCTSLLPPSLSKENADLVAVLAFLVRKSKDERAAARFAIYASALRARGEEDEPRTPESPTPLAFAVAKLPPDMARVVVEFAHGVVARRQPPQPAALWFK